jgi:hypothetical protein
LDYKDAQQRIPTTEYLEGHFHRHSPLAIRRSPFAVRHSPLKNTAPACDTQTGAAIKQTN